MSSSVTLINMQNFSHNMGNSMGNKLFLQCLLIAYRVIFPFLINIDEESYIILDKESNFAAKMAQK